MKIHSLFPTYQFKPLSHHFDGGFGAMADAFYEGAHRLESIVEQDRFINSSLPIAYLYRHAVELYLKSLVIVLHRSLRVPFARSLGTDKPSIRIGQKWVAINRVHSVGALYEHFARVLAEHMEKLEAVTTTDWRTIPRQLRDGVQVIEEFDQKSTFFRYPGEGDTLKGDFKESSMAEIWSRMGPDDLPARAFVELNQNDEVVGAFRMEEGHLERMRTTLRETADLVSTLHFAFRCELAGGA